TGVAWRRGYPAHDLLAVRRDRGRIRSRRCQERLRVQPLREPLESGRGIEAGEMDVDDAEVMRGPRGCERRFKILFGLHHERLPGAEQIEQGGVAPGEDIVEGAVGQETLGQIPLVI